MKLLSYNIHKGVGGRDRRYRFERILRLIEDQDADLVCLQEVDRDVKRTRHDDQPRRLIEALSPLEHLYQLNVRHKSSPGGYGNLVLSRWPFRSRHQVSIRHKGRKPRGAQLVVVETPEGLLHLVHWHLGLSERERQWQVRHLLQHPSFRESDNLPTLIVGDYNDWRNTLARGPFAEHGFVQLTSPRSRFRSFPSYLPVAALDKAFLRGPLKSHHARIVRSKLARAASDHLPLMIEFHLEGGEATA